MRRLTALAGYRRFVHTKEPLSAGEGFKTFDSAPFFFLFLFFGGEPPELTFTFSQSSSLYTSTVFRNKKKNVTVSGCFSFGAGTSLTFERSTAALLHVKPIKGLVCAIVVFISRPFRPPVCSLMIMDG